MHEHLQHQLTQHSCHDTTDVVCDLEQVSNGLSVQQLVLHKVAKTVITCVKHTLASSKLE